MKIKVISLAVILIFLIIISIRPNKIDNSIIDDKHKKILENMNNNNINNIKESSKWLRPLKNAKVTAVAWYYPKNFGNGKWHPGIDMAAPSKSKILAPANGIILTKGFGYGYGNFMVSAHQFKNDVYTFLYAHMNKPGWGNIVVQGQQIGEVGSTGNSTGPHLHFEVFRHYNKSLSKVKDDFIKDNDFFFGLGYTLTGSCSNIMRIKPHDFLKLKYLESY